MIGGSDASAERDGYGALRHSVAARPVVRDVVRVAGPEATAYLQGQLSQDVEALAVGAASASLLLSPQGRVDAYVRVARLGEQEFLLDTERGFGDAVVARLQRFRLRTQVEFELATWAGDGLRGPDAPARAATVDGASLRLDASWPGLSGVDLLGSSPFSSGEGLAFVGRDVPLCPPEPWEAARIESGQPVAGREIDATTIAAEVGLVERTVSFTKGCFTGQELVARLDARGSKVARRLAGLVVGGGRRDPAALVGAVARAAAQPEGGREAGRLTSVAWSPGLEAMVALSVLHRTVSPPADLLVELEDGTVLEAEARPLPLVG